MRDSSKQDPEGSGDGPPRRAVLFAFLFVIVLGILGFFVVHSMISLATLQDCAATGRRNC